MKKQLLSLVAVMALGVTAGSAWAETEKKIVGDNWGVYDTSDMSVAIHGDVLVAGAFAANGNQPNSGAGYVFQKDDLGEWNQVLKISPPDIRSHESFGYDVDFDGENMIFGAPDHDKIQNTNDDMGAAYIVSWPENQTQKLLADDGGYQNFFGSSVSIDGDYAIVGATGKTVQGKTHRGGIYIFERNNNDQWVQKAKFDNPNVEKSFIFGSAVAIKGDRAVVRAWPTGINPLPSFTVYVYERHQGNWILASTILSPDKDAVAYFHISANLDLEDDRIVIGGPRETVYVYKDPNPSDEVTPVWSLEAKLKGSDITPNLMPKNVEDLSYFGKSVAISGDYIAVGAARWDAVKANLNQNYGAIYIYKRKPVQVLVLKDGWFQYVWKDQWVEHAKLTADSPTQDDRLGWSVDIDACQVVGSAPGVQLKSIGAVYHFSDIFADVGTACH